MKRVRKSKEFELDCIISLKHANAHCRFVHGFFTSSCTTEYGFDFEVSCQ